MLLCQAARLSRYCGMWLSDRLASKWLYITLIQELAWHWDETDFPSCLFRSGNQIVFPPPVCLPSFSCFATSSLIYSLSACPQPTVSHSLVPASHLRRKMRQNSRINTLSATQQMHTHIKGSLLSSIFSSVLTQSGPLKHLPQCSHSHSVPLSPSHTCPRPPLHQQVSPFLPPHL